MKEENS